MQKQPRIELIKLIQIGWFATELTAKTGNNT